MGFIHSKFDSGNYTLVTSIDHIEVLASLDGIILFETLAQFGIRGVA